MGEVSDKTLMESVKKGSEKDFKVLYERYKKPIYNYLYYFLGNRPCAEDCAQEVFMRLYRHASKYNAADGNFSSWLFRMAKNVALDLLRKKKIHRASSLDAPLRPGEDEETLKNTVAADSPDPVVEIELKERKLMLKQAIWKLPDEDREPIILCDIEGIPHKTAAEILGCLPGTLTVRLFRARQKLAAALGWMKKETQ